MTIGRSWATWLDLAVEAAKGRERSGGAISIRPLAACGEDCFVVCLGERELRSNDGSFTVFRDVAAAERFLGRLRIDDYRLADEPCRMNPDPDTCECLKLVRSGLTRCRLGQSSNDAQAMCA